MNEIASTMYVELKDEVLRANGGSSFFGKALCVNGKDMVTVLKPDGTTVEVPERELRVFIPPKGNS